MNWPRGRRWRRFCGRSDIADCGLWIAEPLQNELDGWEGSNESLSQVSVIQTGVMIYNETHTNPPSSIEALVNAGRLPKRSSIYASPLKYQRQVPKPVSYSDSDYEIIVEGRDAVIRLKASVLNQVTQV